MNNRSFTLIELLVVIAIVGILSGIVLMSSSGAVNSAQDTRIKKDIDSIRKVILSYKALYGVAPIEDPVCNIGSDCSQLSSDLLAMNPSISFPTNPLGGYYTYYSADGGDFAIEAVLSNGHIYQYSYSLGFSEAEELITNGTFETGNTTGWTITAEGSWYNTSPTTSSPHSGVYSLRLEFYDGSITCSQSIDLTNVDEIHFWYYLSYGGYNFRIDSTDKATLVADDWTEVIIDTSSYSGVHTIQFYSTVYSDSGIRIDDVSALARY